MSELAHPETVHGYTLLGTIGAGSYGTVCQAQSPGGFPAAIKFSPRSGRDLFDLPDFKALEELRALTHPSLLKIFASWEDEHALVIAMYTYDLGGQSVRADGADNFYHAFNSTLRSREPARLKALQPYLATFKEAMALMPVQRGTASTS